MLRKLADGVHLLPGSPSTLIVDGEGGSWIIDPGYPLERSEEIKGLVGEIEGIILTHFHSDHIYAAKGLKGKKYASIIEAGPIIDARMRLSITLGACCSQNLLWLKAEDVPVDETFLPPCRLGPGEVVPLPGHTFGQVGYLTDSGVFYVADALFGEKLLESVKIPYHLDYRSALETLYGLRDRAKDVRFLVPGHGPVAKKARALSLIERNIEELEKLPAVVRGLLAKRPMTAETITAEILGKRDVSSIILSSVTVRSVLYEMYEKGEVRTDGLHWYL